jgi:hypothetical protein
MHAGRAAVHATCRALARCAAAASVQHAQIVLTVVESVARARALTAMRKTNTCTVLHEAALSLLKAWRSARDGWGRPPPRDPERGSPAGTAVTRRALVRLCHGCPASERATPAPRAESRCPMWSALVPRTCPASGCARASLRRAELLALGGAAAVRQGGALRTRRRTCFAWAARSCRTA